MPVLRWESGYCRNKWLLQKQVAIAETSDYFTSRMFITRRNGKNWCKCQVFMESKPYSFNCSVADKEKIKKGLIEAWNKRYKED